MHRSRRKPTAGGGRFRPSDFWAGASGTASIETFTVLYDGHGSARHGVVIARTADGGRTLACVPASDERTLDTLLSLEQSPVGADGELRPGPGRDSLLEDPGTTTLFATVPLSSVQRFNGNS
jgi:Thiolase-like protein type 1 additional C-terminal domain